MTVVAQSSGSPNLAPLLMEHRRAGGDCLWSFTEVQRRSFDEYGYSPDQVGIWFFQECSMDEVAMNYKR